MSCPRNRKTKPLRVKGFQGTSLLDFPGRVSSLVFIGGCNLSCGFCHNPGLVLESEQYPDYPLDELFADLEQRKSFIDGIVVSGGEPTLAEGLIPFLERIKDLDLQVKLDTNGLTPQVLETLLERRLVDYVAVDFKTAPQRYSELHSQPVDVIALLSSCRLVIDTAPEYEFRTTCVPGLVDEPEIVAMGEVLRGASHWVLQQYVPRTELLGAAPRIAYPGGDFARFQAVARPFVDRVSGRGW